MIPAYAARLNQKARNIESTEVFFLQHRMSASWTNGLSMSTWFPVRYNFHMYGMLYKPLA